MSTQNSVCGDFTNPLSTTFFVRPIDKVSISTNAVRIELILLFQALEKMVVEACSPADVVTVNVSQWRSITLPLKHAVQLWRQALAQAKGQKICANCTDEEAFKTFIANSTKKSFWIHDNGVRTSYRIFDEICVVGKNVLIVPNMQIVHLWVDFVFLTLNLLKKEKINNKSFASKPSIERQGEAGITAFLHIIIFHLHYGKLQGIHTSQTAFTDWCTQVKTHDVEKSTDAIAVHTAKSNCL